MQISTKQAAAKLKLKSPGAVLGLIRQGILHDLATTKEGQKRHIAVLDSKEVAEVAKTYRPRHRFVVTPTAQPTPETLKASMATPHGILSRLDAIEAKLNKLIAMWS